MIPFSRENYHCILKLLSYLAERLAASLESYQDAHSSQILTFEEDGRFGNLLQETATLLLIGRNPGRE